MSINIYKKLRCKSKAEIAPTISLPRSFFTVTPGSIRMAYIVTYPNHLPVIRYRIITNREKAARFLTNRAIVSGFDLKDGVVSIYHINYNSSDNERLYQPWDDSLARLVTKSEALSWSVSSEFKRCLMGKPLYGKKIKKVQKGSVLPMFCQEQVLKVA